MELTIQQVDRLLREVSQKSGYKLEYASFEYIAEAIGQGMTKKYLYENLYLRVRDAKVKSAKIRLQENRLNVIAAYLGYNNIRDFREGKRGEDPVLSGLLGNYYCYVRRNSKDTVVFRSPVRISKSRGEYVFELRGPRWTYRGVVMSSDGSVFVLMRSESGKQIHHVYRIGKAQHPKVLQGIFSGVSTTFEPIGGRVVLAAVDQPFEKLENKELTPDDLKKDKTLGARLARYFGKYEENNLRINPPMGFNEGDL
ncbi:MAG: hypothetical protein LOY03_01215 [Cyclobacteriaceae bacterium]|jgi:hypothetical protein|nr:hypothetical protein [Cyclobacteriaceae bacterium]